MAGFLGPGPAGGGRGAGGGGGFFTYDTAQYYRCAAALRREGRLLTVVMLRVEQHADRQTTRSNSYDFRTYTYTATFLHQGQEREVTIEQADYVRLTAGDPCLNVRYDTARNDFIADGYSLRWLPLVLPLFFWGLLGWALWPAAARPPVVEPTRT